MTLRRRFAYYFATRLGMQAVLVHGRRRANRSDGETSVDGVMMTLWTFSVVWLAAYSAVVGWWLLTGRGPGATVFAMEPWWPGDPEAALPAWR